METTELFRSAGWDQMLALSREKADVWTHEIRTRKVKPKAEERELKTSPKSLLFQRVPVYVFPELPF